MEYVGSHVQFLDEDTGEEVSGMLMSINQNENRVSIDKAIVGGKKMVGTQLYYLDEMTNLKIVEQKAEEGSQAKPSQQWSFLRPGLDNIHLKRLRDVKEVEIILAKAAAEEHPDDVLPVENVTFPSKELNTQVTVLAELNDGFRQAIDLLRTEKVVGLGLQGLDIGRTGTLGLLLFGLRDCILIFDIRVLGREAFEQGLGEILQHPQILKVIHDCRYPSDLLFHKYGVRLVNVFDTQVANAVIFRMFDRDARYPKYVSGLQQCLMQYLNVDHDKIYPHTVRQSCRQEDERIWIRRPLPVVVVEAAARAVMRLRTLRLAMMEQLLSEVNRGTDLYLDYIREQPDDLCITRSEMAKKRARRKNHELPMEFQRIPAMLRHEGPQSRRTCPTDMGMAENCGGYGGDRIIFSKVGQWFHHPFSNPATPVDEGTKPAPNTPPPGLVSQESSAATNQEPSAATNQESSAATNQESSAVTSQESNVAASQESNVEGTIDENVGRTKKSPSAPVQKKKPDYSDPLLKTSFMLQRCRLSENVIIPQQTTDPAKIKPAGLQDWHGINLRRSPVLLTASVDSPVSGEDCPEDGEFTMIPSIPQKPVFSRGNSSDEAGNLSM